MCRYRTELSLQQQSPILNTNSNKLDGDINSNKSRITTSANTTRANPSLTINVNNTQYKRGGYESVSTIDQKNLMSTLQPQFNPLKFEEDYKKIKDAFVRVFLCDMITLYGLSHNIYEFFVLKGDLKKDNELIENLLTDMRSKVKETTVSFVDNFLAQNFYELSNGMEAASVVASQLASSTNRLRDSTNHMNKTSSHRDSEVVGLEMMKLLQPVKENNFVNSKLLEFESKNLRGSGGGSTVAVAGQYQSVTKSPFKNKFIQLMPNETSNIHQQLIRHKF